MNGETFDFYDRTSLKSYNLDQSMRYQLNMLDRLDGFTRKRRQNGFRFNHELQENIQKM